MKRADTTSDSRSDSSDRATRGDVHPRLVGVRRGGAHRTARRKPAGQQLATGGEPRGPRMTHSTSAMSKSLPESDCFLEIPKERIVFSRTRKRERTRFQIGPSFRFGV